MIILVVPVRPATHQTAVLHTARLVIVVLLVVALVTNMPDEAIRQKQPRMAVACIFAINSKTEGKYAEAS
jgi:hypothetical protein